MLIFKSINKLNNEVNFKANIGFVPTMGALHEGHISLIKESKKRCKKTLVSIFINPSQFNNKSDFNKYPKKLRKDIMMLKKLKVDYLFTPKKKDIYKNVRDMKVKVNHKYKILCAKSRIGHFEGVLAVINQFLKNLKPKYMFLGEKDYQQCFLIKKFIKKKFKTNIIICKTIRNKEKLALSSRLNLLSNSQIKKAEFVSKILYKFYKRLKFNLKYFSELNQIIYKIEERDIIIDYIELRNKFNLSKNYNKNNFKLFYAFYIKKTRLIDNF